jgi:diguanylate cyclase (GGDEF)-like protein
MTAFGRGKPIVSPVHPSVREVAVLQQATQMVLSSVDSETLVHHMLLVMRNYFGASQSAVYLADAATRELHCRAQNGYDPDEAKIPLSIGKESIAGWAAFTRAPLYIPDLKQEERHQLRDGRIASVLALPLLVRERALGVLEIRSEETNAFDSDAIGLLSVFASQAAIALENARLYSADLRRMRQIEIINLIARTAAAAKDTQQFYDMLVELISDTFEGTKVAVVLTSSHSQLSLAALAGIPEVLQDRISASRQRGILAAGFAQRSLALVNDIATRPDWPSFFPGIGSEFCAPLVSLGEILGAIVVGHDHANFFSDDDRNIAQAAADVCATAARNVQLADELRRIADIDPLTGLYNQQAFHLAVRQEIPRARRHKKEFGLIMGDVRKLKQVNLALGQQAGDDLLQRVAGALKANLRNNDVPARYYGDRFAVLLPELSSDALTIVLGKLWQSLQAIRWPIGSKDASVQAAWASAGYPRDGGNELELIQVLLERLERAKQQSSGAQA